MDCFAPDSDCRTHPFNVAPLLNWDDPFSWSSLAGAGIFGVEMFVMKGGELALNEVAPRPHNSGHYTIEACSTSQFEQHLRAISGLPLGDASLKVNNRFVSLLQRQILRIQCSLSEAPL